MVLSKIYSAFCQSRVLIEIELNCNEHGGKQEENSLLRNKNGQIWESQRDDWVIHHECNFFSLKGAKHVVDYWRADETQQDCDADQNIESRLSDSLCVGEK